MKKTLIIVLLLAALGITVYYISQRPGNTHENEITGLSREDLIGKWKLDSIIVAKDSMNDFTRVIMGITAPELLQYHYQFKTNGAVAISMKDSGVEDSSSYEWNGNNQLVWKEYPADSTADVFSISTLNKDSLVLQTSDNTSLLFTKAKE